MLVLPGTLSASALLVLPGTLVPALDAVGLSREKACFVRLPVKETLGPKIPVTMKLAEGGKSTVNSRTRDRGTLFGHKGLDGRIMRGIRLQRGELMFHHDECDLSGYYSDASPVGLNGHPHGEFIPGEQTAMISCAHGGGGTQSKWRVGCRRAQRRCPGLDLPALLPRCLRCAV